ncbi:homeobox protein Hox-D13a [Triplophysa rosa]|uniref:Homeobox protein Hox-D13 n=1 Tax=Triplophysa rosa TaxID=992332 RepID=A0A9W7WVP2_TRIRA|nr:homeobox protein Hox-D13a [Triplophysa rosa]KAI7809056.1 homeobox protein Hox-D13 [Triplophysa rosa]
MRCASMEAGGLDGEFRSFYPSAFGTHTTTSSSETPVFSVAERPTFISHESLAPYISFPTNSSANESVTFGCYLSNSCCGFKWSQNTVFQPCVMKQNENRLVNGHTVKKPLDMTVCNSSTQHYGETSSKPKEFAFYQGYTGSHPRVSGYVDLPVVHRAVSRDLRHDACLSMDGHRQWDWSSQINNFKDQSQNTYIWKSSLTEGTAASFCQRGRKKRVPYTKLQLKELEREYSNTKFITKEKRRQISSSTNLSERQVTIWFQNRRVKDKKIIPKLSKEFEYY